MHCVRPPLHDMYAFYRTFVSGRAFNFAKNRPPALLFYATSVSFFSVLRCDKNRSRMSSRKDAAPVSAVAARMLRWVHLVKARCWWNRWNGRKAFQYRKVPNKYLFYFCLNTQCDVGAWWWILFWRYVMWHIMSINLEHGDYKQRHWMLSTWSFPVFH